MNMNDWVRAALNDDDEARTAQRYGQVAMRKGRPYRGSGSAVPSGRATLDNDVLKKLATATDGTTSPAGIDDAYLSQTAETAKDDGMAAPEIAKEYLSYRDDPEWKKWDDIERAAMTSSAWAPIWDANSGGAYSRNKMVNAENARLRKNDIQNFFRDRMSLRLATMPTPERFDYSKGTEEYNRDAGIWERIVYGDRGTRKSTGQTTGPIQKYIDQYGRSGSYEERPGTTPMVRTDKTAATTSESFDVPGFSGGSAEGHQPMEPLGMSPKDAADVAAKNALAGQREDGRPIEVSPGASIYDPSAGKKLFTAPLTPAQANRGGDGDNGRMSLTQIEESARRFAETKLGSTIDKESPNFSDRFAQEANAERERLLVTNGYKKPSAVAEPQGGVAEVDFDENGKLIVVGSAPKPAAQKPATPATKPPEKPGPSIMERLSGAGDTVAGAGKSAWRFATNPMGGIRRLLGN